MPAGYRDRLRLEGLALAGSGAAGSAVLLLAVEEARDGPWSTVVQLAVVTVLLGALGPRAVRGWAARATDVAPDEAGTGEPTPLWQLPAICAGLALAVGLPTGAWDAALRVTGGCLLVGLAQATLLRAVAGRAERERGGTLVRLPGSRIVRGTRLGLLRHEAERSARIG